MACEKNTEQMNDVSYEREDSMNTTISEQPGTDNMNDTTYTGDSSDKTSEPNLSGENSQTPALDRMTGDETADADPQLSKTRSDVSKTAADTQKKSRRKENNEAPMPNSLREFRIEQMMSKAELARKAGLSVLTIDRIEQGFGCRMDTKRKILKALGLKLSDRRKLFQEE